MATGPDSQMLRDGTFDDLHTKFEEQKAKDFPAAAMIILSFVSGSDDGNDGGGTQKLCAGADDRGQGAPGEVAKARPAKLFELLIPPGLNLNPKP